MTHERRSYPIGSRIKISVTMRTPAGTLIDPGDVVFQILTPNGDELAWTYLQSTVTRDSLGVYSAWLTLEQSPRYHVRISATGSYVATTGDFEIPVDPSRFPRVDAWVT